jgi:hypothetical protein
MLDDAEELEIRQVSTTSETARPTPSLETRTELDVLIRLGVRYGAPSPEPVEPGAGVREILAGLASRVLS